MHLLLSVPRVEGADLRPWVPPEHSLVISSARNPARSGGHEGAKDDHDGSNVLDWDSASFLTLDMETAAQMSVIKLKVRLFVSTDHCFGFIKRACQLGCFRSADTCMGLIAKAASDRQLDPTYLGFWNSDACWLG